MKSGELEVIVTGYYPDDSEMEGGYEDCFGNPLKTLYSYDRNSSNNYVSLAVDKNVIALKCLINIEGFYDRDGVPILFYACDVGDRIIGNHVDICCGSEQQTYDIDSNGETRRLKILAFQK